MAVLLSVLILGSVLVFFIGCIARAVQYARQPVHLRWELYPVPHEEPHRARHGGSYFEDVDWWTRPRRFNLVGELRYMVPEILFMKGLWEFNRSLWLRSYPFHCGLYLLIATVGLVALTTLLDLFAPCLEWDTLGRTLHWLYTITGVFGLASAIVGAALMLFRRMTSEELRAYTTPGDIFNLCWFIAAFGSLFAGFFLKGADSPSVVAVVRAVLTFDASVRIPGLLAIGLTLSALLAAYIPFTHMSHFIAKYFTYHSVRWNDQPVRPGDRIEKKLAEYLTYRPTWAATHVGADGVRTWAEVATTNPAERAKP